MCKRFGWILAAVLLVAVPAVAQDTPPATGGWHLLSLDDLEELPILEWLVGLVIDQEERTQPQTVRPAVPSEDTSRNSPAADTDSVGGWEPEG